MHHLRQGVARPLPYFLDFTTRPKGAAKDALLHHRHHPANHCHSGHAQTAPGQRPAPRPTIHRRKHEQAPESQIQPFTAHRQTDTPERAANPAPVPQPLPVEAIPPAPPMVHLATGRATAPQTFKPHSAPNKPKSVLTTRKENKTMNTTSTQTITAAINPICADCPKLRTTCRGTTCQIWTGCVYKPWNGHNPEGACYPYQ